MTINTPALRSKKLTQAAKDQQCSVQIMGVCYFNPETVVLAYLLSLRHGLSRKAGNRQRWQGKKAKARAGSRRAERSGELGE